MDAYTEATALQEAETILNAYKQQNSNGAYFIEKFNQFNKNHNILNHRRFPLEELINIKIETTNDDVILSKISSTQIPVMITLETKELKSAAFSGGIDLICVLDCSGSMSGQKMNLLKETLNYMIKQLSENDRLSLISFDDRAQTLCNLLPVTEDNQTFLLNLVNRLYATNGTNIISGMQSAVEVMSQRENIGNVTSIFLLSDGVDLRSQIIEQFENAISYHKVEENFAIQTFGFGSDHDPNLMRDFAKLKNGSFYFIKDLELIEECFVDALTGMTSVIAKNGLIQVKIEHPPKFSDLRIIKTYGNNWSVDEATQLQQLKINQVLGGGAKNYLFSLNMPPLKKPISKEFKMDIPIVTIAIYFESIEKTIKPLQKQLQLKVNLFEEDEQQFAKIKYNKEVLVNHLRVKGADVMDQAFALMRDSNYEQAKQVLDEMMQEIKESGLSESNLILQVLLKDLNRSKDSCSPMLAMEGMTYLLARQYQHMAQQPQPQANGLREEQLLYCNSQQTIKRQELMTIKLQRK